MSQLFIYVTSRFLIILQISGLYNPDSLPHEEMYQNQTGVVDQFYSGENVEYSTGGFR